MKHSIFTTILLILAWHGVLAQNATWNRTYQDYFNQYSEVAIEQMVMHGIPASITLAQGVLESGAGRSELARKGNNHFGIKCNGWQGRKTYHDDDALGECFRAYGSVYESYEDHSKFLVSSPRYSRLFQLKKTDYKGWARGLKACGYATSPTYATRLIEIIELYKLYQYDTVKSFDRYQINQIQHGDLRHIQAFNKNYYVVAKQGDTFRSIADDVNLSSRRLASFNERDKDAVLTVGEKVWLKKKRRSAPKEYKNRPHIIKNGESVYDISQQYGIRLKNLYKINNLAPDYVPQIGDRLYLCR